VSASRCGWSNTSRHTAALTSGCLTCGTTHCRSSTRHHLPTHCANPSEDVARLGRKLDEADGFVVLVGEYNHGYPAVLKNAMDHTFVEWLAFVGRGNVGGARAIEQLRQVTVEFEMSPLRHAVHILPDILRPAKQADDPFDTSVFSPLEPRLAMLADDLEWWASALAAARISQ